MEKKPEPELDGEEETRTQEAQRPTRPAPFTEEETRRAMRRLADLEFYTGIRDPHYFIPGSATGDEMPVIIFGQPTSGPEDAEPRDTEAEPEER